MSSRTVVERHPYSPPPPVVVASSTPQTSTYSEPSILDAVDEILDENGTLSDSDSEFVDAVMTSLNEMETVHFETLEAAYLAETNVRVRDEDPTHVALLQLVDPHEAWMVKQPRSTCDEVASLHTLQARYASLRRQQHAADGAALVDCVRVHQSALRLQATDRFAPHADAYHHIHDETRKMIMSGLGGRLEHIGIFGIFGFPKKNPTTAPKKKKPSWFTTKIKKWRSEETKNQKTQNYVNKQQRQVLKTNAKMVRNDNKHTKKIQRQRQKREIGNEKNIMKRNQHDNKHATNMQKQRQQREEQREKNLTNEENIRHEQEVAAAERAKAMRDLELQLQMAKKRQEIRNVEAQTADESKGTTSVGNAGVKKP